MPGGQRRNVPDTSSLLDTSTTLVRGPRRVLVEKGDTEEEGTDGQE